jgi:hypothetical protein
MGLDTSHNAWHGAYSRFMRFRIAIAKTIGIDLMNMSGFIEEGKSWYEVEDPLKFLLHHSDCDGELSVEECRAIAVRLREIAPKLAGEEDFEERAIQFAKGCEEAVKFNEVLDFH